MTRIRLVATLFSLLIVTVAGQQPRPEGPVSTSLVLRNVTLIDGVSAGPGGRVSVVIRGGRIEEVVPSGQPAAGDIVVNGEGLYAIPGLIDAHVHLSPSPMNERLDDLRRAVEGGVTGVFDLAGDTRETSDLARMAIAGDIEAPSIFYAALVSGPAFFTDPRVKASSLGFAPGSAPWAQAITPATDLVRAVAAARGTGATALKLYAALDADSVKRLAQEGRAQGLRLVAHGTVFPAKPSDLVAAGVNMLAHVAYLVWEGSPASPDFTRRALGDFQHVPANSAVIENLLISMRDRHVSLNPTLWIFEQGPASKDPVAPVRTAWMNEVTRRASQLGVRIVAGTDELLAPGERLPTLHRELELLVSAGGLTPAQAIASATANAAEAMGVDDTHGTIERGKAADLILLSANPLDDIRNTRAIRYVIKDGRIVFDGRR